MDRFRWLRRGRRAFLYIPSMNPKPSAPVCSVLALLAMPMLGVVSIPFWAWQIDSQIRSAPNEIYSPDPGQFGGFAVIAGSVASGFFGACVGLGLVWFAKCRRERWLWLRVASLLLNGFGVLAGAVLLINHLIH